MKTRATSTKLSKPVGADLASASDIGRGGVWEMAAGVALSLWVAFLHCQYFIYAGPLWRDEVGSIDFASMPTLGDIWRHLQYDNFPPLFVLVARVWLHLGLADELGWRALGLLVAGGTLAVLWVSARLVRIRVPLLALAFYAANPLVIRVGDSMRPYGLGFAFIVLTLALLWKCVEEPSTAHLVWAAVAATFGAQSLYQGALFVFAFTMGGVVVAVVRRQPKLAAQLCLPGAIAALSLLPHLPNILKGRDWLEITERPITIYQMHGELFKAVREQGSWMPWAWAAVGLTTLGLASWALASMYPRRPEFARVLYGLVAQIVGVVIFVAFLLNLGLQPRAWYFLILLAPTAFTLDLLWATAVPGRGWWLRAGLAVVVVAASGKACLAGVEMRATNVDLVARALQQDSKPGDMVIVSPWYYGVALQRYFPATNFVTLPPMRDLRIHRYDLMKAQMAAENPMGPVLEQIRTSLRGGHSVWVVGLISAPPAGQPAQVYPPYHGEGPKPADAAYFFSWMYEMAQLISTHATAMAQANIPVPENVAVNPLEDVAVTVFHGWKE